MATVDVLVVGGGVQGLLALRRLVAAGYSAVLVESGLLGGRQSGHAHGLLHRGYHSQDAAWIARLNKAAPFWDAMRRANGLHVEASSGLVGFASAGSRDRWFAGWQAPNVALPFQGVGTPAAIAPSVPLYYARTPEYAINCADLLRRVASPLAAHIGRVRSTMTFELSGSAIRRVNVTAPNGRRLAIQPRSVVFAAGGGNAELVRRLGGPRTPGVEKLQSDSAGWMIVLRGPARELPTTSAFFPESNRLTIVSRRDGADNVWLIDGSGPNLEGEWIATIAGHLRRLTARPLRSSALRWGVYPAPKYEPAGHRVEGEGVESFGFSNLAVAWPVKLTLAPLGADDLLANVRNTVPQPRGGGLPATWSAFRQSVPVAPERWRRTPLAPWRTFAAANGVHA